MLPSQILTTDKLLEQLTLNQQVHSVNETNLMWATLLFQNSLITQLLNSGSTSSLPNLDLSNQPKLSSGSQETDNGQVLIPTPKKNNNSAKATAKPKLRTKSPNYVKKPPNAYLLWGKEQREKMGKYSFRQSNEISIELGTRWRAMSASEKQPYYEEQKRQMELQLEQNPELKYAYRGKRTFLVDGEFVSRREYLEAKKRQNHVLEIRSPTSK
ncbi:unnamed protein product [Caenorhabditis nigoni]